MVDPASEVRLVAQGVEVELDRSLKVGAMRYSDANECAVRLNFAFDAALPPALRWISAVLPHGGGECLFVWRSPTETWVLTADRAPLPALQRELAGAPTCCLVEQTGGILALRVTGPRTVDLLRRIGAEGVVAEQGEARTGRIADVAVTVVCSRSTEVLLLVDRAYLEHLLGWICATLTDFQ